MKQIKWFDRKFEYSFEQNIFPSILERLEGTSIRMRYKIDQIAPEHLIEKPDGRWSIQENIGHLLDLEPLWKGRLQDILSAKECLRPADLENQKTDSANHNRRNIHDLLKGFTESRDLLLKSLYELTEKQVYDCSLHPRLKTPMRTMDLFLFVAEHDDHHLARISELNRLISSRE